jgi:hypothetical protein
MNDKKRLQLYKQQNPDRRGFFQKLGAAINPLDNGASWSTSPAQVKQVQAQRQQQAKVQRPVNRPQYQQQGQNRFVQNLDRGLDVNSPKPELKIITPFKPVQAPPTPGLNTSFANPIPTLAPGAKPSPVVKQSESAITPKKVLKFVANNTSKLVNTAAAGTAGAIGLFPAAAGRITGNKQAEKNALADSRAAMDLLLKPGGGLLGNGSFLPGGISEVDQLTPTKVATKSLSSGLATAPEVVPFAKGAMVSSKSGQGFWQVARRLAAQDASLGLAGSVGSQTIDKGKVDPVKALSDTLISVFGGQVGYTGGAGINKFSSSVTKKLDKSIIRSAARDLAKAGDEPTIAAALKQAGIDSEDDATLAFVKQLAKEKDPRKIEKALLDAVDNRRPAAGTPDMNDPAFMKEATGKPVARPAYNDIETPAYQRGYNSYEETRFKGSEPSIPRNPVVTSASDDELRQFLNDPAVPSFRKQELADELEERALRTQVDPNDVPAYQRQAQNAAPEAAPTPEAQALAEVSPQAAVSQGATKAQATPEQQVAAPVTDAKVSKEVTKNIPDAAPDVKAAMQQVLDIVPDAKKSALATEKLISKQKAQRIGAGRGAFESAGGGAEGLQAKLGQLKGKYKRGDFVPIEAPPETVKSLIDHIEQMPDLQDFQKLNAQVALGKFFGTVEGTPTRGEITRISDIFGPEMAAKMEAQVQASLGVSGKVKEFLSQLANAPKAAMATADLSMGGRQGLVIGTRFPKEWAKANIESIKMAKSSAYFDEAMKSLRNSPNADVYEKMGLDLGAAFGGKEEAFMKGDLIEKIPVFGRVTKASDRAYGGGLAYMRAEIADKIINKEGGRQLLSEMDDKALQALGEFVNTATGRGGKKGGFTDRHARTLGTALFSPKLWASRVNMLNPKYYARLQKDNPAAAKYALQSAATFIGFSTTVLSLAAAMGADVGVDPRSADFGKIKVGNTRYDTLGGFQQNIRFAAQMLTGEKINSETGELQTLGPDRGFGKPSRKDLALQFFESKENPLISTIGRLLEGTDPTGEPINPVTEVGKLGIPLNAQSIYDTAQDTGSLAKSVAMNVPGIFGVGTQTYGSTPTKDSGTSVIASDGTKPKDLKGFINKKKISDKKLASDYDKSLTKEDKQLVDLSKDEVKEAVKNGYLPANSETRYDSLKKARDNALGKSDTAPSGLSTASTDLLNNYNKLSETGKKGFDNNSTIAPAAKTIVQKINKQKPEGLKDFEPNNKIAKRYAQLEADLADPQKGGKMSTIDKKKAIKSFWVAAAKENVGNTVGDVYTAGSNADDYLDNGDITKDDLDQAIELDNQLYNAGLAGLKFSKKFRNQMGYTLPAKYGGSGGSGGGGGGRGGSGGKGKTTKIPQGLSAFLSINPGKVDSAPQFSTQATSGGKMQFKYASPKSGSSGKIKLKT